MIYAIGIVIILLQITSIYLTYSIANITRENQLTMNDNLKTINNNLVIVDEKTNNLNDKK